MKKLEYKTPELEIINVEVEGIIANSPALPGADMKSVNTALSIKISNSSYSMDDYNWK
ncbi:MAG: hypothetical protein R3Y22_10170 [Bacteroidales bacterium]